MTDPLRTGAFFRPDRRLQASTLQRPAWTPARTRAKQEILPVNLGPAPAAFRRVHDATPTPLAVRAAAAAYAAKIEPGNGARYATEELQEMLSAAQRVCDSRRDRAFDAPAEWRDRVLPSSRRLFAPAEPAGGGGGPRDYALDPTAYVSPQSFAQGPGFGPSNGRVPVRVEPVLARGLDASYGADHTKRTLEYDTPPMSGIRAFEPANVESFPSLDRNGSAVDTTPGQGCVPDGRVGAIEPPSPGRVPAPFHAPAAVEGATHVNAIAPVEALVPVHTADTVEADEGAEPKMCGLHAGVGFLRAQSPQDSVKVPERISAPPRKRRRSVPGVVKPVPDPEPLLVATPAARRNRKPRLSEALMLQKALASATWTDSAAVEAQSELIIFISDDDAHPAGAPAESSAARAPRLRKRRHVGADDSVIHEEQGVAKRDAVARQSPKKVLPTSNRRDVHAEGCERISRSGRGKDNQEVLCSPRPTPRASLRRRTRATPVSCLEDPVDAVADACLVAKPAVKSAEREKPVEKGRTGRAKVEGSVAEKANLRRTRLRSGVNGSAPKRQRRVVVESENSEGEVVSSQRTASCSSLENMACTPRIDVDRSTASLLQGDPEQVGCQHTQEHVSSEGPIRQRAGGNSCKTNLVSMAEDWGIEEKHGGDLSSLSALEMLLYVRGVFALNGQCSAILPELEAFTPSRTSRASSPGAATPVCKANTASTKTRNKSMPLDASGTALSSVTDDETPPLF